MTETVTAIVENGAVLHEDDASPLPWWSISKVALSAAALALVADGRLSLDEPVNGRSFTLRHLLQHRAGLPEYGALPDYHRAVAAGEIPWPVDALLTRVKANQLVSEPGATFLYSNIGYLMVRQVIERAADAPLGMALDQLVFAPLGITDVTLATLPGDLDGTLWGNDAGYHPGWVYHGLLAGPAASAATFIDRLLSVGLLPPHLLDAMTTALPLPFDDPARPWRKAGYGLGLMIGRDASDMLYIGHTGGGPGSVSAAYRCVAPEGTRTGAAFALGDDTGAAERRTLALASGGTLK